ncbi:MAG TPA: beta-mannosidase, partial [Ktedonobacter sp.]|nr:beta-mannosidase [Ktedonobacter sp.]
HNKSDNGARKLTGYIIDNVRIPADLPGYIYATQFIQAEAMGLGIRSWRRHWGHLDEQTGGALLWQLDDCWPVSSWAIIDYAFRPKPAYYAVKRELAPLVVGLARVNGDFAEVWAVNGLMKPVEARVNVSVWTLDGKLVAEEHLKASLDANQGTELGRMHYDEQAHIVSARLLLNGETVARATLWPEPYKYLTLPDPEITVERLDAHTLRVEAKRPAKGVWLTAHDGVQWSDNMLDLLPNEAQIIKVHGLGNGEIQVQWLGKDVSQRQ